MAKGTTENKIPDEKVVNGESSQTKLRHMQI